MMGIGFRVKGVGLRVQGLAMTILRVLAPHDMLSSGLLSCRFCFNILGCSMLFSVLKKPFVECSQQRKSSDDR